MKNERLAAIAGDASFATTMKLYGGLTAEAIEKAAGTLGDALEPTGQIPDKWFSVSRDVSRKSFI
jgi:hypothetical protein